MNMSVHRADDGSLYVLTDAQQVVVRLSPHAVMALCQLVLVAPHNPVVHQHIQTILRQLPAVTQETALLGLTARAEDGTVLVTDAGHRFTTWLEREWADWAHSMRHPKHSVDAVWGWSSVYPAAHIGGV